MGWIIGIIVVVAMINAFSKSKQAGNKWNIGTKVTASAVAGYAIGRKILKV